MVNGTDGLLHYALFFYESILDIAGFCYLSAIFHRSKIEGKTTAFYLIYYGLIRTVLEHFRDDSFILKFMGLPISQICSVAMILIGISLLVVVYIKNNKEMVRTNEKQ